MSSTDPSFPFCPVGSSLSLTARSATAFALESHQPLHRRAPARDVDGRPFGDFMVLIPGLRERPRHELNERVASLQAVLLQFREVVFADLNLPLNLLWVTVRPRPGVILELFAAVKLNLPEAKLVGQRWE